MGLFLISLAMLFGASLLGYFIIRFQTQSWPTDLPSLPGVLWISTALLIVSSFTMQWSLNGIRMDQLAQLRRGMASTLGLGAAFLLLQVGAWITWLRPVIERWAESGEYRLALTGFYVLTGLHALHVVGGLIPMSIVTRRAWQDRYTAQQHAGVYYCAMYWHFLGVVWVVLFFALLLGI